MKYSLPEFSAVGETSAVPEGTAEQKASQIPEPKTYHLLCMLPEAKEAYDSGILKADKTMHFEELLSPVLFVAKIGPDAFKDEKRFPSGPSCKVGDFVIVRPNSGTRMKIHGTEWRLINDDSVEATIEDPRGLGRV
jgi:co-chaperonin GroES (HSP10)